MTRIYLFIVLILFLIVGWVLKCQKVDTIPMSTLLQTARTGDLLYFRSRRRPWYYKAVVPMTHIGVIFRRNGHPYVLEMHQFKDAPPGYPDEDGPHIYPLKVRLDQSFANGPWDLFYSRYRGPPVVTDISWAFSPAYVPYNYSYIKNEVVCHTLFRIPHVNTSTKMHCANYAGWVLKKLGILSPHVRIDCVFPLSVRELAAYDDLHRIT